MIALSGPNTLQSENFQMHQLLTRPAIFLGCHNIRRVQGEVRLISALLGSMLLLTAGTGCTHDQGAFTNALLIENHPADLILEYDAERDRIVRFGPINGPNLLETRDLDVVPNSDGEYTFFGGMYTWVAPQNGWVNQQGGLHNWPPDPAMDRGPCTLNIDSGDGILIEGPVLRSGLQQTKRISISDDGICTIAHALHNTTNTTQHAGIWSITAAKTGSTIAVRLDSDNWFVEEPGVSLDSELNNALWAAVANEVGPWIVFDTGTDLSNAQVDSDSFKAFVNRAPSTQIAIWSDGYWLVRSADPPDIFSSLSEVGESSIEIYGHFGLNLFEAELLSAYQSIPPGEMITWTETWQIVPSDSPDPAAMDFLYAEAEGGGLFGG